MKRLIEFRASNEALFTGKRNSAKIAWRYEPDFTTDTNTCTCQLTSQVSGVCVLCHHFKTTSEIMMHEKMLEVIYIPSDVYCVGALIILSHVITVTQVKTHVHS